MNESTSPWSDQFQGLLDSDAIRKRSECLPDAFYDLESMPLPLAEQELMKKLKGIIFLTDRELSILQQLIGRSYAYAAMAYPTIQSYLRNIHSDELLLPDIYPVCLTGIAGVGKSSFLTALQRALPQPAQLNVGSAVYGGHVPYISHTRLNVDACTNLSDLLRQWLPSEITGSELQSNGMKDSPRIRTVAKDLVPRAVRYGYRMGYCASLIDEMQFLSRHASANARITQVLLSLSYLKCPLIYAANFSMCHKLMKRNQEDKDRLLAKTVVLMPLKLNDGELGKLLRIYDIVLGPCVNGSLTNFMSEYGTMTLGIKRKVRDLTVDAYVTMREQKATYISAGHLRHAYEKKFSSSHRADIENLMTQYSTGKPVSSRMDLWCPFGHEYNVTEHLSTLASRTAEEKISNGLLHDLLTPNEKRVVKPFFDSFVQPPPPVDKIPKARPKATSNKRITAESLLTNTLNHQMRDS
jgi:hypothetical protein